MERFSRFSRDLSISLDVAKIQISYSLRQPEMSSFTATRRKCLSYLARRYFFFQVRETQLMHVAINRRDTQNFKCLVALGRLTSVRVC